VKTRTFGEDFTAALRGDPGYRGVEPKTAAALCRLGLISPEQAWEEALLYEQDWIEAWDESKWWWALAEIACEQYRGFWARLWGMNFTWKRDWIAERRDG
jgi:hypothetical protein